MQTFSRIAYCSSDKGTGKCREFPGTLTEAEEVFYSDGATPFDTACAQKKCTTAKGTYTAIASVTPDQIIRASCNVPANAYCEDYIGIYWGTMTNMEAFCSSVGGTLSQTVRCATAGTVGTCRKKPCTNQDELVRYYSSGAGDATSCGTRGWCATGPTRPPPRRTRSMRCAQSRSPTA